MSAEALPQTHKSTIGLSDLVPRSAPRHVADIGAAWINERPPYASLLERKFARLSAFDGDDRQKQALVKAYGADFDLYVEIIGDGKPHKLYLASAESGMSSILKPSDKRLAFFNGFSALGLVHREVPVKSKRLDDIEELKPIDYLKMDVQGSELMALKGGKRVLRNCVAMQLEVSFFPLYERQPTFGEVDVFMRSNGFVPHCFVDVKRWSIAPTIRDRDFQVPFNQLLEADIVYVKDPLEVASMATKSIVNLAYVAWYCYESVDLAVYLLLELERRGELQKGAIQQLASQR